MNELVSALRRELAQLQSEIEKDPRVRKIKRINELLTLYASEDAASEAKSNGAGKPEPRLMGVVLTKKVAMKQGIESFLSDRGSARRTEILDHLKAKGIMGHEKNPVANLAAFLSDHKDTFAHDGEGNWHLLGFKPAESGEGGS